MLLDRQLFEVFARSYDPPYWIIEDLLHEGAGSVRDALHAALAAVTAEAIAELDHDTRTHLEFVFAGDDTDRKCRLYIVSDVVSRTIEQTRLATITAKSDPSAAAPYDHPALKGVHVDKEGLVSLAEFTLEGDGLIRNDHTFFLLPPVPGSNAGYWLLQEFARHDLAESVRIRLDPLLHGPSNTLQGRFYKATVYGRPLDWARIRQLRSTDHGEWVPRKMSRRSLITQYAWVPHNGEVDFLCEELPVVAETELRGSRYFHAVYEKANHHIIHVDGAIRTFTPESLNARALLHVREAGKVGTRVKLFRIDRPIDPDLVGGLAQAFFFWNYDVARYFGAKVPVDF